MDALEKNLWDVFDKKELISTFELSRYDVERFNKPTINKINKNIKLEKV